MQTIQPLLTRLSVSQADLARGTGLPKATTCRLVSRGEWPRRNAADARAAVGAYLKTKGAKPEDLAPLFNPATSATEAEPNTQTTDEDSTMLLMPQTLNSRTRQAFGLSRQPFVDEIQSRDDVFASPHIRNVRNTLLDVALNHGFCAIVGESGSGKSTLAEDLEQRIMDESRPVTVIRPWVIAMEDSESRGKPLRASDIAEAIVRTLSPKATCKSSPDARFTQVHQLLRTARMAGQHPLLLIEEAHGLHPQTLKHLKRFLEMKDGLTRLMGIALIAQPELKTRLNEGAWHLREVVARIELVELMPLDDDLPAYLQHKLTRAGSKLEAVFAPDACDAIRARLTHMPRNGGKPGKSVNLCHPQAVNNLVARAMNAAVQAGFAKVDGNVIAGV